MNHASIAMQALGYRMAMITDSITASRTDPAQIAKVAVECGDPTIDYAIRRIGTAWVGGGLPPDAITEPWSGPLIDQIFADDPTLLDAIDDIIKAVHRHQFSRPRGGTLRTSPQASFRDTDRAVPHARGRINKVVSVPEWDSQAAVATVET